MEEILVEVNYIQEIIEGIIKFSLIGVAVHYVIFWQMERTEKKTVHFKFNSEAVVRLPSILGWLGLILILLLTSLIIGSFIFPDHYEEDSLFEGFLYVFPIYLFSLLSILSLFWKIHIHKDSDYFCYRSTFGRTHIIYYTEISYFKTWKHLLLFKYKRKFFFVSPDAINYEFFLQMLIKNNVKKKFKPFKPRTRL